MEALRLGEAVYSTAALLLFLLAALAVVGAVGVLTIYPTVAVLVFAALVLAFASAVVLGICFVLLQNK